MFKLLYRGFKNAFLPDPSRRLVSRQSKLLRAEVHKLHETAAILSGASRPVRAIERIGYQRSRYAVMGVRSHGKTTVVSVLMRQRLLPSDGPPITAFPCLISMTKEADNWARIKLKGGKWKTIPADQKSLEQWVALTTEDGLENLNVKKCEQLSLHISKWPLDEDLELLDVQGDDDRASIVADEQLPLDVDVVLYVVRVTLTPSDDGLSFHGRNELHNEEFLSRLQALIRARGASGVKVIINIFFPQYSQRAKSPEGVNALREEWKAHTQKSIPFIRSGLHAQLEKADFRRGGVEVFFVAAGPAELVDYDEFGFASLRSALCGEERRRSTAESRNAIVKLSLRPIRELCENKLRDRQAWETAQSYYEAEVAKHRQAQDAINNAARKYIRSGIVEISKVLDDGAAGIIKVVKDTRYKVPESSLVVADFKVWIGNEWVVADGVADYVSRLSSARVNTSILASQIYEIISVERIRIDFKIPSDLSYFFEGMPLASKAQEARQEASKNISDQTRRILKHWRRSESKIFEHIRPMLEIRSDLPNQPSPSTVSFSSSELNSAVLSIESVLKRVDNDQRLVGPG